MNLDFSHIQQREEHWAIVDLKGKAGHTRTVPMPGWVKAFLGEWLQGEDARSRQERRIDLERRVLRRGPEQRDIAVLDVRQHDVLLRLVEAVDLVDE